MQFTIAIGFLFETTFLKETNIVFCNFKPLIFVCKKQDINNTAMIILNK